MNIITSPVSINYRGHKDKLFKRDFAGEIMKKYKSLKLLDYGFVYHKDLSFPQDDLTWFLLKKIGESLKYCKNCLIPSTKPHITFNDEGVCSARLSYLNRPNIDWKKREDFVFKIVDQVKKDKKKIIGIVVVPVSGGKDSTYQALKLRELGLNPLCVTSTT